LGDDVGKPKPFGAEAFIAWVSVARHCSSLLDGHGALRGVAAAGWSCLRETVADDAGEISVGFERAEGVREALREPTVRLRNRSAATTPP
jgi:hypothetical protein